MFSLSVSTLVLAIFILFYHVKPRFHVNDLLRNWIREKRISSHQHDICNQRQNLTIYCECKVTQNFQKT